MHGTPCYRAGFWDDELEKYGPLNYSKPDCDGRNESGPGGGIVCPKCGAWFCY